MEGCNEDYPYGFVDYNKKMCCAGKPEDSEFYDADYKQNCFHGQKFRGKNHLLQILLNIPVSISFRNLVKKFFGQHWFNTLFFNPDSTSLIFNTKLF